MLRINFKAENLVKFYMTRLYIVKTFFLRPIATFLKIKLKRKSARPRQNFKDRWMRN